MCDVGRRSQKRTKSRWKKKRENLNHFFSCALLLRSFQQQCVEVIIITRIRNFLTKILSANSLCEVQSHTCENDDCSDVVLAGDTIQTHADDNVGGGGFLGEVFPKVRSSMRYVLELTYVSYILWLDDDTIPNLSKFLSIVSNYDRDAKKADARGLYMGVAIKNMQDNPSWNPEYAKLTSLHNYTVYMQG